MTREDEVAGQTYSLRKPQWLHIFMSTLIAGLSAFTIKRKIDERIEAQNIWISYSWITQLGMDKVTI